jgi:hypothetical protein
MREETAGLRVAVTGTNEKLVGLQIKVRCQKCQTFTGEIAKFCNQRMAAI